MKWFKTTNPNKIWNKTHDGDLYFAACAEQKGISIYEYELINLYSLHKVSFEPSTIINIVCNFYEYKEDKLKLNTIETYLKEWIDLDLIKIECDKIMEKYNENKK